MSVALVRILRGMARRKINSMSPQQPPSNQKGEMVKKKVRRKNLVSLGRRG